MAQALYRKYRSKSLKEVVGQSHITEILEKSIEQDRTAHAYLFTGPKGVGKTSVARILAYRINGLPYDDTNSHLDIIEIDAASNNGVDDVRALREKVQIAPVSASKKVYIIDEVHMLSKQAFNALLKTLEEPPEHVVFILATTDMDKLPATIISRTQRFSFKAADLQDIITHLEYIASQEKITIDLDAIEIIARRGDGSFRDSISLLDQLSSLVVSKKQKITKHLVETSLGLAPSETIAALLEAIDKYDTQVIAEVLKKSRSEGVQTSVLTGQLIDKVHELSFKKTELLPLLDALLEVGKSSRPDIKLAVVLMLYGNKKPSSKYTALRVPHEPILTVPVPSLTEKATKLNPESQPDKNKPPSSLSTGNNKDLQLNWTALIEYARSHHIAIHSVLSQCTHELIGRDLTLYTGNAFYKKKLDDSKYRAILQDCLGHLGFDSLIVTTISSVAPPKDSTAATVAAIMGGGEEVNVS